MTSPTFRLRSQPATSEQTMSTPYGSFRRQPNRPAPGPKPAPEDDAHLNLAALERSFTRYLLNSPEPPARAIDHFPIQRSIREIERDHAAGIVRPTRVPVPMRAERRTKVWPAPLAFIGGVIALPVLMPVAGGLITIAITGVVGFLMLAPLIQLVGRAFRRR